MDATLLLAEGFMRSSEKIYYIAEIGINHNGDIDIAKELIKRSKQAGFDAVKFQKRDINLVYSKEFLDSPRESPWGKTQRDQKRGLEFGQKEYEIIDNYCKEIQIDWSASAWEVKSLEFLDQFNLKFHKNTVVNLQFSKCEVFGCVVSLSNNTYDDVKVSLFNQVKDALKESIFFELTINSFQEKPLLIKSSLQGFKDAYKELTTQNTR